MINELSIITPTLNEEKYLPKLLRSIAEQHFTGKLQVIIVDGRSIDKTVQVAESFKDKIPDLLVLITEKGIGYQRNRGAEKAKYKYLLFLDADMVLPPKFFKRLLPKVATHGQFIETVLLWSAEPDLLTNVILASIYPLMLFVGAKQHYVPGAFILTTKDNHVKIHGFREDVNRGEDTDYGVRSYQKGARHRIHLWPYALHSARRVHKMGRVRFFTQNFLAYRYSKKYGLKAVAEKFHYPFGDN